MSAPKDITPTGSVSRVYLDTKTLPPPAEPAPDNSEALRADAVQKLMADFGFTEEMARAVVGN